MKRYIIIPVRTSSNRILNKPFVKIHGVSIIERLISRLKDLGDVVICTSTNSNDEKLVEIASKHSIHSFRGPENNIPLRLLQSCQEFGIDFFVTTGCDNPLCELDFINETFNHSIQDFVQWEGFPIGSTPLGIRTEALKQVCSNIVTSETGWGRFFINKYIIKSSIEYPNIRLTLDYEDDLTFFTELFNQLGENFNLSDITKLINKHPEIATINNHLNDAYWENFNRKVIEEGYQ